MSCDRRRCEREMRWREREQKQKAGRSRKHKGFPLQHLVAFLSKSLSPVERNYKIHDKEMLAIIQALQEWQHFIEGAEHQCEIWTDHKNLEYFMTAKQLKEASLMVTLPLPL